MDARSPGRDGTTDVGSPVADMGDPEQRPPDELANHELRASLAELAGLIPGDVGLEGLLARVARCAEHAIPGADGAGVTLVRTDQPDHPVEALAASNELVSAIEDIQHGTLNEGPCITAVLEHRTVWTGSLGGERMWPRFGPRVGRMGVHSAIAFPLLLPGHVVGAINAYSRQKDAFDEDTVRVGELFAAPAAVAVHNAHELAAAQALNEQLQSALETRPVIDQAIGIIRSRSGVSTEEAFERLRQSSQRENRKLVDVAHQMVNEAVRNARSRTP